MGDKENIASISGAHWDQSNPSTFLGVIWQSADTCVQVDGASYVLNPKEDLTPLELFNIHKWMQEAALNCIGFGPEKFIERAEELKIIRHFDKRETTTD